MTRATTGSDKVMSDKIMVVAVDGPVAAGKGTLGRRLAERYGFAYLDTGSLYRATAVRVLRDGIDPADVQATAVAARQVDESDRTAPNLRDEATGMMASRVAGIPEVRAALLDMQREFAARPPGGAAGAVLDGRDIGTVVCPDAPVKLFVTASMAERARRRHRELVAKDATVTYEAVLADLERRDRQDSERGTAPLKAAPDAHLLDTTEMDIEAAFHAARALIDERL